MTDQHAPPALPAGLSTDAQTTVTFLTGVAANGSLSPIDGNTVFGEAQHKWLGGAAGTSGGTVTYGFAAGAAYTAAEQSFIAASLALWSDVANITFVPSGGAAPKLTFATNLAGDSDTLDNSTGTAAGSTLEQVTSATTTIDTATLGWTDLNSFTVTGGYGPHTVVHEIGHILGLSHSGNYNGAIDPKTEQYNSTDSEQWSIMSYIDPSSDSGQAAGGYASQYTVTGTKWGVSQDGYPQVPQTWMPLDILAAQRLYGVAVNTPLSGGQVFGFNCNVQGATKQFFDFTQNATPILTLWDAGAGNTLDLSGYGSDATVNLNPGTFSSVDGLVNNVGIAYGTAIDRVVSSLGSDTITGNADPDTVAFGVAGQTYFLSGNGGGAQAVSWSGRSDALTGIATVAFGGGNNTVVATGSGGLHFSGGGNLAFVTGAAVQLTLDGGDTIVVQGGSDTVTASAGAGRNLIFGDSGSHIQFAAAASVDTIVATSATLAGGAAGLVAFGAKNGSLTYAGGTGPATVIGGSASVSIQGGTGGGLFGNGGAGGNSIDSGAGAVTVFGSAFTDTIVLGNAAANVVVAGSGAEQVRAASATGDNALYAGSGSDALAGGLGDDTLFAGSGNDTLTGGGGHDYFGVVNGHAGGQVLITDWNSATDTLGLSGYGASALATAAATAKQVGGSTVMRLADNTLITFAGTAHAAMPTFA